MNTPIFKTEDYEVTKHSITFKVIPTALYSQTHSRFFVDGKDGQQFGFHKSKDDAIDQSIDLQRCHKGIT